MMRAAESRVGVLESIEAARQGVGHTWAGLLLPRKVIRYGSMVGGGLVGMWLLKRLLRRKPAALPQPVYAAVSKSRGGAVAYAAVQVMSMLLLPWLRSRIIGGVDWGDTLRRLQPSHLFFRWLGLEK